MKRGDRITEMFCFISLDEKDDCEGIPAMDGTLDGISVLMPLVGADRDRVMSLLPLARDLARQTGKKLRLVRFTHLEELGEVDQLLSADSAD